jgi:hypothetical protein
MGAEEEGLGFFVILGRAEREPGILQDNLQIPGPVLRTVPE